MLPGTSSLSKTSIIEQIIYIANEVGGLLNSLKKTLAKNGFSPEALDKFLRQDVAITKSRIDMNVEKILDYLASARVDLIDNKELYIGIANRYSSIVDSIETAIHRIILALKLTGGLDDSATELINNIINEVENIYFILQDTVRGLLSVSTGTTEMLKRMEEDVVRVGKREGTVDDYYKLGIEKLAEAYRRDPVVFVLLKEALDELENTADKGLEQATDLLFLAKALSI